MAKKRKKPKMEFRYYQMPAGSPILALLGQKWVQNYGNDVDYLHFHNYLEIGFCYEGDGVMAFGEAKMRFSGREFTVIPPNYAHTTNSDLGTVSKWEYLFIDVEGFMKKFLNNPVKAEKMIQRIYSKALFLKENESPSIAAKILKIMNIMREGEEFYIEESSGVLAALLVEIARLNRASPEDRVEEETGKLTNMITRVLDFVSYHYYNIFMGNPLTSSKDLSISLLKLLECRMQWYIDFITWTSRPYFRLITGSSFTVFVLCRLNHIRCIRVTHSSLNR